MRCGLSVFSFLIRGTLCANYLLGRCRYPASGTRGNIFVFDRYGTAFRTGIGSYRYSKVGR